MRLHSYCLQSIVLFSSQAPCIVGDWCLLKTATRCFIVRVVCVSTIVHDSPAVTIHLCTVNKMLSFTLLLFVHAHSVSEALYWFDKLVNLNRCVSFYVFFSFDFIDWCANDTLLQSTLRIDNQHLMHGCEETETYSPVYGIKGALWTFLVDWLMGVFTPAVCFICTKPRGGELYFVACSSDPVIVYAAL